MAEEGTIGCGCVGVYPLSPVGACTPARRATNPIPRISAEFSAHVCPRHLPFPAVIRVAFREAGGLFIAGVEQHAVAQVRLPSAKNLQRAN